MPNLIRQLTKQSQRTYTTRQAAKKLNISERTLRDWIQHGHIKAEKLNPQSKSVYRIDKAEVDRILAARNPGVHPTSHKVR